MATGNDFLIDLTSISHDCSTGLDSFLVLSVERVLLCERKRGSVSCQGRGNWESLVVGPFCDMGPQ